MSLKSTLKSIKEKTKQKHVVLIISLAYNFVWSICKIVFGVIYRAYFFCVSGVSTILFGFIKKMYLKYFNSPDENEKKAKAVTISTLLIISGALFTFYMTRLFFVSDVKQYGLIPSIAIATFSFAELGISIFNFVKSKAKNDILLQAFRGCSLVSSCYAITLTRMALLSATTTPSNFNNALSGLFFGSIAIIIGLYLLVKSATHQPNKVENLEE